MPSAVVKVQVLLYRLIGRIKFLCTAPVALVRGPEYSERKLREMSKELEETSRRLRELGEPDTPQIIELRRQFREMGISEQSEDDNGSGKGE